MRNRISTASLDRLRAIPLFSGCRPDALAAVNRLVDVVDVVAGTTLTREGGSGRETFIVVSGTAEVVLHGKRLAEVGLGAVVGEMAVLQHEPQSATVTALTPMQLLVVAPSSLAPLLEIEGVARKVLIGLSSRLRAADDQITSTPTRSRAGQGETVRAR